ncbi:hypothetical protein ACSNOI_38135 [Actinomadura kijaniata]|uniref:hypothetical protein n=1 Tax=Actinomadura kijaniata TaxID=46161 RepID=UPI003F1B1E9A
MIEVWDDSPTFPVVRELDVTSTGGAVIGPEIVEGLALVAPVRAVRTHGGFDAHLGIDKRRRQFAEVIRSRPVQCRVIVAEGFYASVHGVTPLGRVADLVARIVAEEAS